MDWMVPFQSAWPSPRSGVGISARLLRHLFLSRHLDAGMKVLEVGCSDGELTRFLASQSIHAVGCDSDGSQIAAARRIAPDVPFYCADPTDRLPVPDQEFHLVLARNLDAHRGDLSGNAALRATANLLTTLRPGGELILVQRTDPTAVQCADRHGTDEYCRHLRSCFARHLGAFPGVVKVSIVADSLFEHYSIPQSLGLQPATGFITASLKLNSEALSVAAWHSLADREIARNHEQCCLWGVRNASEALPAQRAA